MILVLALPSREALGATTVSGAVFGTWDLAGSPYLVEGDLLVDVGRKLVIEPGVDIRFRGPYVFRISGVIEAVGSFLNPILFHRDQPTTPWEGVYLDRSESGCVLEFCQISGALNSGIRILDSTPTIRKCVIAGNSSSSAGAGLRVQIASGTFVLADCVITNNALAGSKLIGGGGVALIAGSLEIRGCLLAGNVATGSYPGGGGVLCYAGTSLIANCTIKENYAGTSYGGGVCLWTATLEMRNCVLTFNYAYGGSGIFNHGAGGLCIVLNSSILHNVGMGLQTSGSPINMTNVVCYFNNSNNSQLSGPTASFCDVQNVILPGPGNINAPPGTDENSFMLLAGSACIDAGHPGPAFYDTCFPPALATERNDIGAFGGPGACAGVAIPTFILQPQSQGVPLGDPVSLSAGAVGSEPLFYQWFLDGKLIQDATNVQYVIGGVQSTDDGVYTVVAKNLAGSVSSASAVLTVVLPHAAAATATVVNGFVVGVDLQDPGLAYTNAPVVRIIGDGTGATAVASISNRVVTAVVITNPGRNYTTVPLIVISPPYVPQPTLGIAPLSRLAFSNLEVGTNYQLEYIEANPLKQVGAPFAATSSSWTQMVAGTASAGSYRLAVVPAPIQASAVAQVVNGFVVGVTVTEGGSGYISAPAVEIRGGGGSNATAVARIDAGKVVALEISDPGSGYGLPPSIVIALPPAASIAPGAVTQVMRLDCGDLSPYDRYQVEWFSSNGGSWTDIKMPFVPTTGNMSEYLDVTDGAGSFRLKYLPGW